MTREQALTNSTQKITIAHRINTVKRDAVKAQLARDRFPINWVRSSGESRGTEWQYVHPFAAVRQAFAITR